MRATSRSLNVPPVAEARSTMSPNSSGRTSRPRAVTVYSSCWPGGDGGAPILPAANCAFCAFTAWAMSFVVSPRLAMRSGCSHRRIE